MSFIITGFFSTAHADTWDIQKIKNRYAQVRAQINGPKDGYGTRNEATLTMDHLVPGIGRQEAKYTLHFTPYESTGDGYIVDHHLQLIESSYNIGELNYYEEYLFDESGNIIFVYGRRPDIDKRGWIETRWYFNGFQVLKSSITKKVNGQITELPATTNPGYYFEDTMWKIENLTQTALTLFATVNLEYEKNKWYNSAYNSDNFDVHTYLIGKMQEDIMSIPGASKYSLMADGEPTADDPYFSFRLGENDEDQYNTLYWFHVYPFSAITKGALLNKSVAKDLNDNDLKKHRGIIGRYYMIKIYDVATDTEMPIVEWIQEHGEIQ